MGTSTTLQLSQIDIVNLRGFATIVLVLAAIALIIFAITHSGKGIVFALIFLAGAGATGYFEYQYQLAQAEATTAIQTVYGNTNLTLHCERFVESLTGDAKTGERYEENNPNSIWVDNADCTQFFSWVKSDHTAATTEQATGVYAVAAAAAVSDRITDVCVPITAISKLASALGASPAEASAMTTDYYTNVWSKTPGNPGCSIV